MGTAQSLDRAANSADRAALRIAGACAPLSALAHQRLATRSEPCRYGSKETGVRLPGVTRSTGSNLLLRPDLNSDLPAPLAFAANP
jgi:hypothetical protein